MDCLEGALCIREDGEFNIPGGLCIRACPAGTECSPGSTCVTPASIPSGPTCQPVCTTNTDCPSPARSCDVTEGEASGTCVPVCQSDEDCGITGVCNRWSGRCMPTPTDGALPFEACVRNEDCASLLCSARYEDCGSVCSIARQGCPEPYACIGPWEGSDLGICARRCELDADCADLVDATCISAPAPAGVRVCV